MWPVTRVKAPCDLFLHALDRRHAFRAARLDAVQAGQFRNIDCTAVRGSVPPHKKSMNIRFVSSLTPEDEVRLAEALLAAVASLLDKFPIAYTLKIEAGDDACVFQHDHAPCDPAFVPASSQAVEST
jgi:hypothetical protein